MAAPISDLPRQMDMDGTHSADALIHIPKKTKKGEGPWYPAHRSTSVKGFGTVSQRGKVSYCTGLSH